MTPAGWGRGGPRGWFPVGLHGTLLAALALLLFPAAARPVEDVLRWLVCQPLRAYGVLLGGEARAAAAGAEADEALVRAFRRRQRMAALEDAGVGVPAGLEPVLCQVIDRRGRGGADLPSELVLDLPAAGTSDLRPFATYGGSLVGFLGPADGGHAVVRLLHHRMPREAPRRIVAAADLGAEGTLRFLLEPAARIDAWPLRCTLIEDPYKAFSLRSGGYPVRTDAFPGDADADAPPGLRVGALRIWGYPLPDGEPLPVGFFVEPSFDPRTLTAVVLWRPSRPARPGAAREPSFAGRLVPVRRLRLPAPPPTFERWYLTAEAGVRLPAGAALVRGRRLVGRVAEGGPGDGIAVPLGSEGERWTMVLLPDDPLLPPENLLLRAVGRQPGHARLALAGPPRRLPAGYLFTGSSGPDCPAGLLVGEVRPGSSPARDLVVRVAEGSEPLSVLVRREGPR